ncbi:MAG: hypothetical protein ACRDNS_27870, partial [Trebonia sp.]
VKIDSQAFAQMSKAYVISACGTVDDAMIERLELSAGDEQLIRNPDFCGGSSIVAPDSHVIAGPLGSEEGILYADLDLEVGIKMKLRHDFAGHYNRPDVFQLRVNTAVPQLYGEDSGTETAQRVQPVTPPPWLESHRGSGPLQSPRQADRLGAGDAPVPPAASGDTS